MRSVLGVVIALLLWMAGFYTLASLLAVSWPDYQHHARAFMEQRVFSFTTVMACFNLLFWVVADIFAGWLAGKISQRQFVVRVVAGLIVAYLAAIHLVLSWSTFPWWYNLLVVIPAVPAILYGGRLATNAAASRTATTS